MLNLSTCRLTMGVFDTFITKKSLKLKIQKYFVGKYNISKYVTPLVSLLAINLKNDGNNKYKVNERLCLCNDIEASKAEWVNS